VPIALSTGHEVGLGVTGLVFILFALASAFLFPRFRPDYPGRGLLAFIVVAFVFFFGMLTAVEVFGADTKHHGEAAAAGSATAPAQTTTAQQPTTAQTTTQASTTTTAKPAATKVPVGESEFKITLATTKFNAGEIIFEAKNNGKIQHDLAIKQTGQKTKLISPGGTAELKVTLKPGTYELYCTVPGHEAAGMKQNITVSSAQTTTQASTTTTAKPAATKVQVAESEFKITLASTKFKAGEIIFEAKNDGKIQHDLAIKQTGEKTKLISPGGTAELKVTLKPGTYELYCTVPGHEAAGMKQNITVS
jgi:uncharacterized cupredoxin-like copper-binding protein